jgi:hypothetical protein
MVARLPLTSRVLCRQFMLRVIDLEALSIHADVSSYLGQFAGIAIMGSAIHAVVAFFYMGPMKPEARLGYAWHLDQYLIATMMLVIGLFAVVSWDTAFPDHRDIMVLSPLPIQPRTILFAKLSASGAILGIAVLALNIFSGFVWPFALGMTHGGYPGFFRALVAYWFTMAAATLFLYCSVLTVQGLTALVLPRRLFLWTSAVLQLAAFAAFFATYFLQGTIISTGAMVAPQNRLLLASSPSFWFFALFSQLNGTLPEYASWFARRAWIGLGISMVGAIASLLLSYLHIMRRTVEQPDLLPGTRRARRSLRLGSPIQTAILQFTLRTLARSRQHRVILAFYLSIALAIALGMVRRALAAGTPRPFSSEFPILTSIIMVFTVMGFTNVFSLPISLTANWMLRTTQTCPTRQYIAATNRTLLVLAVLPAWLISAALGLTFKPLTQVAAHLAILALFGFILAEATLISFHKVPFTCSLLPGETNLQFVFWRTAAGIILLSTFVTTCEIPSLHNWRLYAILLPAMMALAAGLWTFNRHQAKSAVLYYEELPEEVITTLGLLLAPRSNAEAN